MNLSEVLKTNKIPAKATEAEIDAGTNDTKFTTPKTLADQTVLLKSAAKASASDINTGTENNKYITPKYLKDSEYYTQRPTAGEKAGLVGNNTDIAVGADNKFVTQTGLQHGAEKYAADAGSDDTYVITLDPAPTSYTAGMVVHFKANTVNTGACTLNVNGLGAKTIVKEYNITLADGDIKAGQLVSVIYDGTNFQMLSPVGNTPATLPIFKSGIGSFGQSTAGTYTITIAHGLGKTPKSIRLDCAYGQAHSHGYYNSSSSNCVYSMFDSNGSNYSASISNSLGFISNSYASATSCNITVSSIDETNITLSVSATQGYSDHPFFYYVWEAEA